MTTLCPTVSPLSPTPEQSTSRAGGLWSAYSELVKLRLTAMVGATAVVGFLLAGDGSSRSVNWLGLAAVFIGTFLAGAGASAFNQIMERGRDARMTRTRDRPIPAGHISVAHAGLFAVLAGLAGVGILLVGDNALTASLGLANLLIYVLIYTPMKAKSTLNTIVGAVCGAIPPMMGWTAASGHLGSGAFLLGAILFVWQIPHFLALAWMYRDDYERGGFKMLPVIDKAGRLTTGMILLYSVALIPCGLALSIFGITGRTYALGSLVLAACMIALAFSLMRLKNRAAARRVFLASVIYLPLLLILMVANPGSGRSRREFQQGGSTGITSRVLTLLMRF